MRSLRPTRGLFGSLAIAVIASFAGVLAWYHLTARQRVGAELQQARWDIRQQTIQAADLPEAERSALHAQLQAEIPGARWEAARVLGAWRDRRSLNALLVAMRDEDGTRRTCLMAQVLGHIGDNTAVPELLWATRHPTNVDLRMCARHALVEIGDEQAVAPLIEQARSASDDQDRTAALAALGELGFTSAEPALRAIARGDSSAAVRTRALDALWQINLLRGDPVPRLLNALGRHEHWVTDDWLLRQLTQRWDHRCAEALNRFAARPDIFLSIRVRACALLLERQALQQTTLATLETDPDRSNRFLAAELRRSTLPTSTYAVLP